MNIHSANNALPRFSCRKPVAVAPRFGVDGKAYDPLINEGCGFVKKFVLYAALTLVGLGVGAGFLISKGCNTKAASPADNWSNQVAGPQ